MELPGLREGVRALRGPGGVLLHDPFRWQLFHLPADLPVPKRASFLHQHGLDAGCPTPGVRARVRQVFIVRTGLVPSRELRIPPDARFTCACCGTGCRSLRLGPLLPADIERLQRLDWTGTGRNPGDFFVDHDDEPLDPATPGRAVYLRRLGQRCQFLRDDDLCDVHARFGAQAKPVMCRLFPYAYCATPTGISVGLRLFECASAPVVSRGLPVLERRLELSAMLEELETVPLVPPSVWVSRDRLMTWEEYERVEAGLVRLPAQAAPGGFAAAVLRAFDPEPPAGGLDRMLERAGLAGTGHAPLQPAALALEDRICRSRLAAKELFETQDLSWGAATLVLRALVARLTCDGTAESLNRAWKACFDGQIREWCDGLDLRGIAARIAS